MNEGFELLNGLFYWLPDELNLETKIEKEEEWERSSIWWEELGDMGGQVGVTVWGGVKVKGIKTTVCCKIYCEAWIYAQVSIEGEQETQWLSQWGSVLAENVGEQAQERRNERKRRQ